MEKITAPFTDDQVKYLNEYQHGPLHPFTCGNEDYPHNTTKVLFENKSGFICLECGYTQTWAWKFMSEPFGGHMPDNLRVPPFKEYNDLPNELQQLLFSRHSHVEIHADNPNEIIYTEASVIEILNYILTRVSTGPSGKP